MDKVSFSVSHEYSCDVLVAGGGVGGLAAAVSSARLGQRSARRLVSAPRLRRRATSAILKSRSSGYRKSL